VRLAGRRASH